MTPPTAERPARGPARGPALAEYALYQAGWFAMVLGASWGRPAEGSAVALLLLAAHLLGIVPAGERIRELALIAIAAAAGLLLDTLQVRLGALRFEAGVVAAGWAPPWIALLWGQFAATFRGCLAGLSGRPTLAAALGLVGGPAAYFAGARLGAVELGAPAIRALASIAAIWAVALPAGFALARALDRRAPRASLRPSPR